MGCQIMDIKTFEEKAESIKKDIKRRKQLLLDELYRRVNIIQAHELLLSDIDYFIEMCSCYYEGEYILALEEQMLNLQARADSIHNLVKKSNK